MKRVLCMMMALLLIGSLVACGNKTPDNPVDPTPDPVITDPVVSGDEGDKKDGNVLQIPATEIYFTYPKGWYKSGGSTSVMMQENEDCMVAVCYSWDQSFEGKLADMVSYFSLGFLLDAAPESRGILGAQPIEVTSTKATKVAGYDSVQFTGKVNNNGEWDCHVYGYTYVVDGTNLMVIGLVSTQAQDAQMIKDIDALTDQIAASVRTEK